MSTSQTTETFTFGSPIELNNSQKYILVISTNATNTGGVRAFYNDGTNPYSQGQMTAFLGGETEWRPDSGFNPPDATDDLDFEITFNPVGQNITLTANINNFTVEIDGYGNYTTSSGSVTTDINDTEISLNFTYWNASVGEVPYLNLSDTFFFNSSIRSYDANLNPYVRVNSTDAVTGAPIEDITIEFDGTIYNGTNYVYLPSFNETINITGTAIGYELRNLTINTSTDQTISLFAEGSLQVNIIDEDENSLINESITLEFKSGGTLSTNTTSNGTLLRQNLEFGEYVITAFGANYSRRDYTVNIASKSFQTLNIYLTRSSDEVTFTIQDQETNELINNATVTMQTRLNDQWTSVAAYYTDITGKITFTYNVTNGYRFIIAKTGFIDKTFILDPIQFDSYQVGLKKTTSLNDTSDYAGVTLYYIPKSFKENTSYNFNFTISDPAGRLTYYGYTISWPGGNSSQVGSNVYGSQLQSNVTIGDVNFGSILNVEYFYFTSAGVQKTFSDNYFIDALGNDLTIDSQVCNTYGLGVFERYAVAFMVVIFVSGLGILIGGQTTAGVLGILMWMYMAYICFVSIWTIIPTVFIGFLVLSWRTTR